METMTFNYLFYLGVIIPCVITIVIFVIFIVCWHKHRLRQQIMKKKYDPHGKLKSTYGTLPEPPAPPDWELIEKMKLCEEEMKRKEGNYDESPETPDSQTFYSTFHDSGMTEMTEIHCKVDCDLHNYNQSTDSDDSGFTSSRSAHYIHSASNSNAQDQPTYNATTTVNGYTMDELMPGVHNFHMENQNIHGLSESATHINREQPLFNPLQNITSCENFYPQFSPMHTANKNNISLLEHPSFLPLQYATTSSNHIQMSSDPVKSLSNNFGQERLLSGVTSQNIMSDKQMSLFKPIHSAQCSTANDQILLKPVCCKNDDHNQTQNIASLTNVHNSPLRQNNYMSRSTNGNCIDLKMYPIKRSVNIPTVSENMRQMTITTAMVHHPNIQETNMSYSVV